MAIDHLRTIAPPATRKKKGQVTKISAHNEPAIGEPIVSALEKVDDEGGISIGGVEENRNDARRGRRHAI